MGMTINNDNSIIYNVGFTYNGIGTISAGEKWGTDHSYTFKDNEFINYIKACRVYVQKWSEYITVIGYLYMKTNLNKELSYGTFSQDCYIFEPQEGYAIVGFHGYAKGALDKIGCIYQKYYYDCSKLDEGKF